MNLHDFVKNTYLALYRTGVFNLLPDSVFIPIQYRASTGKKLNLNNPTSFNEKIQWLKIYDRNPEYCQLVDKLKVRSFVAQRVGDEYVIPLLGVWDTLREIDLGALPDQFVIKTTHDSGGIVICRDKDQLNWPGERRFLAKHLRQNHYYLSREWAYKDVQPRLIAEQYMIDDEVNDLRDYKFFCFNGEPKLVQVDFDRATNHKRNLYDTNWTLLDLKIKCENDSEKEILKPTNLDEMLEVARKLSLGIPQVRVDLYSVNGRTYFGEMTLYHGSGYEKFTPQECGERMGRWIDLSLAYGGGE